MMAKYLRLLLVLLLGAVTSCKTAQQIPQQSTGKDVKREFRGLGYKPPSKENTKV